MTVCGLVRFSAFGRKLCLPPGVDLKCLDSMKLLLQLANRSIILLE